MILILIKSSNNMLGRNNMQITPLNNYFYTPHLRNNKNVNTYSQTPIQIAETAGSLGISPKEVQGKSMINFCGFSNSQNNLTEADNNFVEAIGKIYRLDKKQIKELKSLIKNFLKENNFKRLYDMKGFEFLNESGLLTEQISNLLELTDYEDTNLSVLMTWQVNEGDLTRIRNKMGKSIIETDKFVKDFTPIENLLNKHGIENSDFIYKIFNHLSSVASNSGCNTIFEAFSPQNSEKTYLQLQCLSDEKYGSLSKDEITDLMIDFIKLSGMTQKERLEGINIRKQREEIEDGFGTIILSNKISEKFGIKLSDELFEMLNKRQTEKEVHKNGIPIIEIAYKISDEYNLPQNSVQEIIEIIEEQKLQSNKQNLSDLIDVFSKKDKNE